MKKEKNNQLLIDIRDIKFSKRKTGSLQGYYDYTNDSGKRERISKYGPNEKIIIAKFQEEYDTFDSHMSSAVCSGEANFRNFVLYWLQNVKKPSVKPSTLEVLMRTYNNYIAHRLGSKKVVDIQRHQLQEAINATSAKGLSMSTVKKVKDFFTDIFRYAFSEGIIDTNLAIELTLPRCDDSEEADEYNPFKEEDLYVFSKEEIYKFEKTAKLTNKNDMPLYKYGYIFLFMLNAGLRRGEMLALRWKDVDLKNNVIYVYKTVVYGTKEKNDIIRIDEHGKMKHTYKPKFYVQNSPKSKSSIRKIVLLPAAKAYLLNFKKYFYTGEDGYIVSGTKNKGKKSLSSSSFDQRFNTFKKASGVNSPGTIHSLRHTYATVLYNNDIRLKSISGSMGHSSTKVTMDTYINILNKNTYDDSFVDVNGIKGV